jgi:dolichol-phosphate mannosyltransferase
MRTAVIIPTYNERENLAGLVDEIQQLPDPPAIFIVDDASPDGTGQLADVLARDRPDIYVRHRTAKLGLGTAHIAGFHAALRNGCQYVITMDADFSHRPRYIPSLLDACRDHDVVIGSRYISGGGTRHCRLRRRLLSRVANFTARTTLGLEARDCTAGFRCYRRDVLEAVDLDGVFSDGYSFLIEMLYRIQSRGFRVGEVPIIYEDRWQGRSKISRQEIFKAVQTVLRLALRGRLDGRVRVAEAKRERTPWST